MAGRSRSPIPWLLAAALLCGATLAIRWPGVAMYDSVAQYAQALSGQYTDWHPPIMARLWALLIPLWPGTAPFFLAQMLLWWGGLGLLAAALGRRQRHGAAACVLLVGAAPLFLGWVTVVLKDAQMACCLAATTGLAAHWRLQDRSIPRWAAALILILIAYATLVRGNAVFATVPFGVALFGWGGVRRLWARTAMLAALTLAVLAASPPINDRLLGAEPSEVTRALPLYDLAGVAHFGGLPAVPGLTPAQWREAERRGCYTPFFWNPYGEPSQCGFVGDAVAFDDETGAHIMGAWAGQVARHPLAYARHRLGHINANLRFWVGPEEPDAVPPLHSERNRLGLGEPPGEAASALIAAARAMAGSPLGWPALWLALAIGLLWASARGAATGGARLGRALALSAACMSASFVVVSLASDVRYHLWSMIAAALALIVLVDARALDPRRMRIAGGIVLALMIVATAARLGLAAPVYVPVPPHIVPAGMLR